MYGIYFICGFKYFAIIFLRCQKRLLFFKHKFYYVFIGKRNFYYFVKHFIVDIWAQFLLCINTNCYMDFNAFIHIGSYNIIKQTGKFDR